MPKRGTEQDGRDEGKDEERDALLWRSIKYCWGDEFLDQFRAYFRKHAHKFEIMAEGKTEEHDLEYQELFNEYLQMFEGSLEDFIEREGSTITDFYNVIRDHQGSTDPQVQLFIDCLLASADYDSFFNVMKKEGRKSLHAKDKDRQGKASEEEEKEEDSACRSSSYK
ncbi:unnamed protein product [Discosporangium mesarthrocarpum]